MATRSAGNMSGVFTDLTALSSAKVENGQRVELLAGNRYQTDPVDAGSGVLLSSGNFANPISQGSGEINTASNSGSGAGLSLPKVGFNLPFKSISAGANIAITEETDTITIDAAVPTPDFYVNPASPRNIVQYRIATEVRVRDLHYPMGGFRFNGNYKKARVPIFSSTTENNLISTATDLPFGMASVALENWYGVFACANNGDAGVTFRAVPFLRVKADLGGGEFQLGDAGEGITAAEVATPSTLPTKVYSWAVNGIQGDDLLIITETYDGRPNAFSGRVTTVTASTTTSVTLSDSGAVAPLDWLLPAPSSEFTHYRYCGSFYVDTAEVRNIADTGSEVYSRGIFDFTGTNTGSVAVAERREPSGYISPLATAVIINTRYVLATASIGSYVEFYSMDSLHNVNVADTFKSTSATIAPQIGGLKVPFSFGPQYYYSNAGDLPAARSGGQQNLYGWIEP